VRFITLILLAFLSNFSFAEEFQILGKITQPIVRQNSKNLLMGASQSKVTLWRVHLSSNAKKQLNHRLRIARSDNGELTPHPIASVQLGMGKVPVLDQGAHGTCATFANTAAIDAALGKGDYISQVCKLMLGNYLENNGYTPSGWDGSLGRFVLNEMENYGVISKEKEEMFGCGGLTSYPIKDPRVPAEEMNLNEFHQLSEPLYNIMWTSLLDVSQAFYEKIDTTHTLDSVKEALRNNNRVTFGILFPDVELGIAGAVGSYHVSNDTWVLSTRILRDLYLTEVEAGHEMIITGYDDDAIAIDDTGRSHKGLLTLRNSWGSAYGDKGDCYMTYDYFMALVVEAQEIKTLSNPRDDQEVLK
jgi:hypothetical protein